MNGTPRTLPSIRLLLPLYAQLNSMSTELVLSPRYQPPPGQMDLVITNSDFQTILADATVTHPNPSDNQAISSLMLLPGHFSAQEKHLSDPSTDKLQQFWEQNSLLWFWKHMATLAQPFLHSWVNCLEFSGDNQSQIQTGISLQKSS